MDLFPPAWWNFHPSSLQGGRDGKEASKRGTLLVSVYDKTASPSSSSSELNPVKNQELYCKFVRLFGEMNGDISGIERVYGVNNPQLRSAFEIKREVIEKQHLYNPGLFRKEGWRSLEDSRQRKRIYLQLSSKIRTFRGEFNDGSHPFVVPMLHGTTENAAFRVIENGFGPADLWPLIPCSFAHCFPQLRVGVVFIAFCDRIPKSMTIDRSSFLLPSNHENHRHSSILLLFQGDLRVFYSSPLLESPPCPAFPSSLRPGCWDAIRCRP